MKALFIACDQALYEEVQQNMRELGVRGYTSWEEVMGCGSETGEPHLGDAVWPILNSAIISITDDERCEKLLDALREIDEANPLLGVRAFWWEVGGTL
jgi:PII-like signaling protein